MTGMVSPAPSALSDDLTTLRDRLDTVDRDLHRLLMERFAIVAAIGATKGAHEPVIRPGREVEVMANRLALHEGAMPQAVLVHFWRTLIGGACAVQRSFALQVCGALDAARFLYGPVTATLHEAPGAAIAALAERPGDVAVVAEQGRWWDDRRWRDDRAFAHVIGRAPLSDGSRVVLLGGRLVGDEDGPLALVLRGETLHEIPADTLAPGDDVLGRYAPTPFTIPVAQ